MQCTPLGFQAALPVFREIHNSGPNNSFQSECQAFFGVASCSDHQLDLYFQHSEVTTYKMRGSFEGGSGNYSSLTFDLEDAIEAQLQANNVGYQANIFIGFFNMDWFDNNASPNSRGEASTNKEVRPRLGTSEER